MDDDRIQIPNTSSENETSSSTFGVLSSFVSTPLLSLSSAAVVVASAKLLASSSSVTKRDPLLLALVNTRADDGDAVELRLMTLIIATSMQAAAIVFPSEYVPTPHGEQPPLTTVKGPTLRHEIGRFRAVRGTGIHGHPLKPSTPAG